MAIDWHDRITRDPKVRGGQLTVRRMRVTVKDVLEFLASGMTTEEILHDFPYLEEADIRAVLAFAADQLQDATA